MTRHIHPTAQTGFDRAAQAYTKGRPDYPTQAVDFLASELGFTPSSRVLDVGAGTGKFTQLLDQRGWAVTAVEPVEGMRAEFRKHLPTVPLVEGFFAAAALLATAVEIVSTRSTRKCGYVGGPRGFDQLCRGPQAARKD